VSASCRSWQKAKASATAAAPTAACALHVFQRQLVCCCCPA
jgi:hypothetical protein